jgi:methylamine---glutamate N-methyltransferase subunit B
VAAADDTGGDVPVIVVPEVRDYTRINAELVRLLDAGHRRVRLAGVDGQRLLARGLRGGWEGVVLIEGDAGPELAADLDAPNLTIACTGGALDGAGSGLRAGQLIIRGDADTAVGYAQRGGRIVVIGSAGARAGLDQCGGVLVIAGSVGRLAGERQGQNGLFVVVDGPIGPFAGRGRRGGQFVSPTEAGAGSRAIIRYAQETFQVI